MQTLAEAEDVEQQMNAGVAASADVTSGYIADEDQDDNSQAVTAGNVATDERSWRRDLEQWASSSSPPPQAILSQFNQRFEHPNSPTSSNESRRLTSDSRISDKNRRISTSSITTTASSTISYLVTSPRAESAGEGGARSHESNEVGLPLNIPHASQRNVPRKPPSSTRTRKEHIVAGLHGDEWSGHRSLNAELKAATAMQQKAAAVAAASAASDSVSPPSSASSRQNRQSTDSPRSPARTLSPIGATTTLRLAAETIASSVISAGHAIGIGAKDPDAALLHPEHPTTPAPRPEALSDAYPAAPPITDVPTQCSGIAPTTAAAPSASSSSEQALPVPIVSAQSQRPGPRPHTAKRFKRANMTARKIEQQRAKEAARKAKEQQKVARWHQRHLAIDAKKLFQSRKDELHNKLANTRNEDARAEVQWELGELYASYAWGEAGEHPDERDKPSLGAGALAHALRVMYEALCSASRREKGAVASITTDANKWARFAQLHMVMWGQGGGKTHFEWAIRAFNEAIKHSGDGTELTGAVCASAAQAIQGESVRILV